MEIKLKKLQTIINVHSDLEEIKSSIKTGIKDLDKLLPIQNGNLVLIGSRSGMGKTSLAVQIAVNSSLYSNKAVAYFSIELTEAEVTRRILAHRNIPDIESIPLYINDHGSISTEEIYEEAKKLKEEKGLSLIIVDYLQLIKGDKEERLEEQTARKVTDLKNIARSLDCPLILLAQLSRGLEGRADRRPVLTDFRESGTIEQTADLVIFIYRDDFYNPNSPEIGIAELRVAKNKITGKIGLIKALWDKVSLSFKNLTI